MKPAPLARAFALVMPDEQMTCPAGHSLGRNAWTVGEDSGGGLRCRSARRSGGECGRVVYWMLMPNGTRLVLEVTPEEIAEMERAHMTGRRVRDYLGLRFTTRTHT